MIALLQRVTEAAVRIDGSVIARAGPGTLALIGIEHGDGVREVDRLLQRILAWRMFPDADGRMNLDLRAVAGDLLLVPQFTLAADTTAGNRPSFTPAAPAADGRRLFTRLDQRAREAWPRVSSGVFGATMQVYLVNDGPVTFWLQVRGES